MKSSLGHKVKSSLIRYGIATLGLVFIAAGVALSIKSDLGTAPVSCPPYVVNLWNASFTVGEYTIMMHLIFIISQVLLLRKQFKLIYLMQIPAAVVFGILTDAAIMAFNWIDASSYIMRMALCVLTVVVTALGVSLEVIAKAWMLAGEQTTAAISQVTKISFSNVKVGFDVFLVLISAVFSIFVFRGPFGNGEDVVIREGTLILAIFTGLCMKITDPFVKKIFGSILSKYQSVYLLKHIFKSI